MQILYLDDYINYYHNKLKEIKIIKPYKNTLHNGHIINRRKFINNFKKFLENNKLNNNIFGEKIIVIINQSYNQEDKNLLKEILEELNYKEIKFINEINLIKIDKNTLIINYSNSYFYLNYINEFGNIEFKIYENDNINKLLITNIIYIINKKKLILNGKNIKELINTIKDENFNYFYYEEYENLYINLLINNMSV